MAVRSRRSAQRSVDETPRGQIRAAREAALVNVQQVADYLGWEVRRVVDIESGWREPTLEEALRLSLLYVQVRRQRLARIEYVLQRRHQ
jgi:DNA-binding transcriptional regulator YiaG